MGQTETENKQTENKLNTYFVSLADPSEYGAECCVIVAKDEDEVRRILKEDITGGNRYGWNKNNYKEEKWDIKIALIDTATSGIKAEDGYYE